MQRSESLVHRQSSPIARLPLGTVSTAGRLEDLLVIMIHCWEELTVELQQSGPKAKPPTRVLLAGHRHAPPKMLLMGSAGHRA